MHSTKDLRALHSFTLLLLVFTFNIADHCNIYGLQNNNNPFLLLTIGCCYLYFN